MLLELAAGAGALAGAMGVAAAWQIRRRNMQRWLRTYLRHLPRYRAPRIDDEIHVLFCFADHYEPRAKKADFQTGRRRVAAWTDRYPRQFGAFRDSDGRTPRHTFFFPYEEYEKEYLDALADLCHAGFGEVEVHLHHDRDTAEGLRGRLLEFKEILNERHGLLCRQRGTGLVKYGFIHGNWALCNSRPDGRHCGVNNEIEVLLETGCYGDFTYPSAPDPTQPALINRIYYAANRPGERASHEQEVSGGLAGKQDSLLMIQGPLMPDWGTRKWGIFPSVENGCLQATQLPSINRLSNWLKTHVQVPSRPDWFFVKLHSHGAEEHDHEALLGEPMVAFHRDLARFAETHPQFHYHYVTAREMVNLIKAAETGYRGSIAGALDWELIAESALERQPLASGSHSE